MADRSHQQLARADGADGVLVGSGRVGSDGVPRGEYEGGEPNAMGGWSDHGDGEGGDGGWCWGMVQQGGPGGSRELEWVQLHHVSQSGLSGDDSPDNYWWPNLA